MLWIVTAVTLLSVVACGEAFAAQDIPRAAEQYRRDLVRESRAAFGLQVPISTFAAQLEQESAFRPDVVSYVGARGIAQFMPATAAWISDAYPYLGPANPLNPQWAIRAMVRYNRHLWDEVGGLGATDCDRMCYVLGSYNGGARWMKRRALMSENPGQCLGETAEINPGITEDNQKQNAGYSRRILLDLEPRYLVAGWGPASCWVLK